MNNNSSDSGDNPVQTPFGTQPISPQTSPDPTQQPQTPPVLPSQDAPIQTQSIPSFPQPENPPPVPVMPHIQAAATPSDEEEVEEPKSNKTKLILFVVALVLIVFLGLIFVGGYLLAYEKINLTKYPEFQTKVAAIVMSIPGTPKTPRYLLVKSTEVQNKLTSQSFDASLAISTSAGLIPLPGLSEIDGQVTGYADFSDPNNIEFNMNVSATKDINLDITKKGQTFYFKINKIDGQIRTILDSFAALDYSFLGVWYNYDATTLSTDARNNLEKAEQESILKEYSDKSIEVLTDEKILKKIKLEEEKLDDINTYKLSLVFDDETLDRVTEALYPETNSPSYLGTKMRPSDTIKNMTTAIWVDAQTYNLRRADSQFDVKPPSYSYPGALPYSGSSETHISFSSSFSDFNKKQEISIPPSSVNYLELLKTIDSANPGL